MYVISQHFINTYLHKPQSSLYLQYIHMDRWYESPTCNKNTREKKKKKKRGRSGNWTPSWQQQSQPQINIFVDKDPQFIILEQRERQVIFNNPFVCSPTHSLCNTYTKMCKCTVTQSLWSSAVWWLNGPHEATEQAGGQALCRSWYKSTTQVVILPGVDVFL